MFYVKLNKTKEEITLKLQTEEVAAAAWVPMDIIQSAARGDDLGEMTDYGYLQGQYPNKTKQGLTGMGRISLLELPENAIAKN